MEIKVGQLWEVVTDNFLCGKDNQHFNRHLKLEKGEVIEIRYPFAWNFRTMDGKYFHCKPDTIINNCKYFGEIWPEVKSINKASTEEIVRLKLFHKSNI